MCKFTVISNTIIFHFAKILKEICKTRSANNKIISKKTQKTLHHSDLIKQRKLKLFGHICRMKNIRTSKLISLNPLFKDVPTSTGRTFISAWKQLWLDTLPTATNDSYGYQQELNPDLLGANPSP